LNARPSYVFRKDAHKVLALLDNPPKPNKRLKDAVKAFKAAVRE